MKHVLKNPANLLIMSIMVLTMAFIFSCTSDSNDAPQVSPVSSSSGNVLCVIGTNCLTLDTESCFQNGGEPVASCPVSSSSSLGLSSSSLGSSSSLEATGSSSSLLDSSSSLEAASSSSASLTCSNIPTTGIAGTAIPMPVISCGTTDVTSKVTWDWAGNPSLQWDLPVAGTYNVRVTGTCDGSLKAASCGTIIVAPPSYGSVIYEGKTYKTVKIGNQTWMAENLNYNVSGSKCYNNQDSYCNTYGRLYNWAMVMALPASCNSNICASQINTKHRGICPLGWHVPSDAEWSKLPKYRADDLAATSGWNSVVRDLTNPFGFSALPGGYCNSDGDFLDAGEHGLWWTASDDSQYNYRALYNGMQGVSSGVGAYFGVSNKDNMRSVRCVQD